MTFANVLESQVKCLESKAGSGTPLCLIMHTDKGKSEVTELSQSKLSFYSDMYSIYGWWCRPPGVQTHQLWPSKDQVCQR